MFNPILPHLQLRPQLPQVVTFGELTRGLLIWHCSWFKYLSPNLDVVFNHNPMHLQIIIYLKYIYTSYFSQQLACGLSFFFNLQLIDQRIAEYSSKCNLDTGRAKELCIRRPIACPNNTCVAHFGSTPTQSPSTPGVSFNIQSKPPTPATTSSVAPGSRKC